ncbi:MAG: hypothetical protein ACPHN2_07410 [Sinimarinibacterium flocculans]
MLAATRGQIESGGEPGVTGPACSEQASQQAATAAGIGRIEPP